MQVNLKKLVGTIAVAGALGLPAFVAGAGAANAATPAPSIPGSVQAPADLGTIQVQPVDWGGDWDDWGHHGWRGHGDWGRGGWGWGWRWGWR